MCVHLCILEREVELLKPLEDVTVYEKETANFDTEISEEDIPGEWKLKGEILRPSPVSIIELYNTIYLNLNNVNRFP